MKISDRLLIENELPNEIGADIVAKFGADLKIISGRIAKLARSKDNVTFILVEWSDEAIKQVYIRDIISINDVQIDVYIEKIISANDERVSVDEVAKDGPSDTELLPDYGSW